METKTTFSIHTKLHTPMMKRLLLACVFSALCAGGAYGQEETLQLKFSNAGVQTALESDYVATLARGNNYKAAASAYLQGNDSVIPVVPMITATVEYGGDAPLSVGSGEGMTANFSVPSGADSNVSITIDASAEMEGQTYETRIELDYPITPTFSLIQQRDRDNDGVPEPDDGTETSTTRLASSANVPPLEVSGDDSRIVLGNWARQTANNQAKLTEGSLERLEQRGEDIGEPPGYEDQGRYNFAFFHSTEVYTYVVVPLADTSNEDKYWNIYDGGEWKSFIFENLADADGGIPGVDENQYYSAEGTRDDQDQLQSCPDPDPDARDDQNARQWTSTGVVTAGYQCVLLAIFDDGPNDGDGEVNGFVTQLGAPGSEIAESGSSGSSSGASDLWLLMLLLAMLALTPFVRRCRFATP